MKLKGEFILREVVGEFIIIPVGNTALDFNGMIYTNLVGKEIWLGLLAEKNYDEILESILEIFEVSREEAIADLESFLHQLKENSLLEM